MGFFDKIKSAVNVVTGGSADVTMEFVEANFGENLVVKVTAIAKADCKLDKVYVKVRGIEELEVRDEDYVDVDDDGYRERITEFINRSTTTFEGEHTISGPQELEEGNTYEWEAEIPMPEGLQPEYHGHNCHHSYIAFAGLDMFGNDPDSGWLSIPFAE